MRGNIRRIGIAALVLIAIGFVFRREITSNYGVRVAVKRPLRAAIWATGQARGCPYSASVGEISWELGRAGEEIARRSTVKARRDGLELWSTPYGDYWTPPSNALSFDLAEQAIKIYGDRAEEVRPGDVVLDCGANVGTFTRTALKAGAAKVVTFEIDPRNNASLRLTFAEEIAAGKVIVVEKGVWDKPDTLEAKFYSNTNLNTVVMAARVETREAPRTVKVPLVRIDDEMAELGIRRVDYIKMDIEGAEPNALAGAAKTINRDKPRLSIATENEPGDIDTVPALIERLKLGYRMTTGPCRKIRPFMIRPEVVFFTAD